MQDILAPLTCLDIDVIIQYPAIDAPNIFILESQLLNWIISAISKSLYLGVSVLNSTIFFLSLKICKYAFAIAVAVVSSKVSASSSNFNDWLLPLTVVPADVESVTFTVFLNWSWT